MAVLGLHHIGMIGLEFVVRRDDPANQLMAHHIVVGEIAERDVVDLVQNAAHHPKTTTRPAREIHLGDVAGNDHP